MLSAFIDGFIAVFWLVGFVAGLSTVTATGYFLNALLRGKKRLIKPKRLSLIHISEPTRPY